MSSYVQSKQQRRVLCGLCFLFALCFICFVSIHKETGSPLFYLVLAQIINAKDICM
jgi:hypothetical protein